MLGPLAIATADVGAGGADVPAKPGALTALMVAAFAGKLVFFGAYVAVMLRRAVGCGPMPFVASFTGYFIALHLIEALYLRRLFAAGARIAMQVFRLMSCKSTFRNTPRDRRRRRGVQRRRDDHRARLEQRPRSSADSPADDRSASTSR